MKTFKRALINWIVPVLLSALPLLAWIDCVANCLKSVCDLRMVVISLAILLFLTVKFFILWMGAEKKLKDDFTKHLIPIRGSGVCVHEPTGEPVCPICSAEGRLVFLWHHYVPGDEDNEGYTSCVCHRCKYKPDIHGNVFKTKTLWKDFC